MRWMPINGLPNLILRMSTSRHVSSYFAADRPMVCQCRQVLRCLKMFTLRHTKLLGLLGHQGLSGELLPPSHLLQDRLSAQQETGEDDLLKSTHRLSHQTHMINGNHLAAQSLPHHVRRVQDKSSR